MGCTRSREPTQEEKAVSSAETKLGYLQRDAEYVDLILRKHNINGFINHIQLQRIGYALHVPVDGQENALRFYALLRNNGDQICLNDMLVMGILLSDGSPQVKAKLLFQVFDRNATEKMKLDYLKHQLLTSVVESSIRMVNIVDQTTFNNLKIASYSQKLSLATKEAMSRVMEKLNFKGGDSIQEQKFVSIFSRLEEGSLTSTHGWRLFLHDVHRSMNMVKID